MNGKQFAQRWNRWFGNTNAEAGKLEPAKPITKQVSMNTRKYVVEVKRVNGQWGVLFALRSSPATFEWRVNRNWSRNDALACSNLLASEWNVANDSDESPCEEAS